LDEVKAFDSFPTIGKEFFITISASAHTPHQHGGNRNSKRRINMKKEMTAEDVVEIITLLEDNDIEVYVDGGWGVDALLCKQTRKHNDLDIALPHKFVPKLRELLEARGYKDVPRDDTRDCNFVLGDDKGCLVDIHSYTFDESSKNIYGVAYEPHHLTGNGSINGYPVKCIPPDVMVEFHTGYDLDEDDYRDVKALCERFGIPIPEEYAKFENSLDYMQSVDLHSKKR